MSLCKNDLVPYSLCLPNGRNEEKRSQCTSCSTQNVLLLRKQSDYDILYYYVPLLLCLPSYSTAVMRGDIAFFSVILNHLKAFLCPFIYQLIFRFQGKTQRNLHAFPLESHAHSCVSEKERLFHPTINLIIVTYFFETTDALSDFRQRISNSCSNHWLTRIKTKKDLRATKKEDRVIIMAEKLLSHLWLPLKSTSLSPVTLHLLWHLRLELFQQRTHVRRLLDQVLVTGTVIFR